MKKQTIKKIKTIAFGLVCFALGSLTTVSTSTYASSVMQQIKAIFNPSTQVVVNGEAKRLQAISYQNTTYLPLRVTADLLGSNVNYKNGVIYLDSNKHGTSVDNGSQVSTTSPSSEQTVGEGNVKAEETKIWYQGEEVYEKYPPYFIGHDLDNKAIITFQGKEYHVTSEVFTGKKDQKLYITKESLLQYMTQEQLNEFQTYYGDPETREVKPIN